MKTGPFDRRILRVLALAVLVGLLPSVALAILPYPDTPAPSNPDDYAAYPDDYAAYMYIQSGDCSQGDESENDLPPEFDCVGSWKFTDYRDTSHVSLLQNPQEFFGVEGAATNRAWEVSTGRPDVVVAVLDSGIRWDEKQPALVNKIYINPGELPKPVCANGRTGNPADTRFGGFDCNHDGFFNVQDYASDGRAGDRNGNGMLDPEDLILTFTDGMDGDNNGYVDDISGWDFYENDNDPLDDTNYGHGTHQMLYTASEAGLSGNRIGQCPNCMVVMLRVGSSFVADTNHYAQAVIYAVDNNVSVVSEALGGLNHPSFSQVANDYAYHHGVVVVSSEADEAAAHHMWPAALDHNMVVNSIRTPSLPAPAALPFSYLYLNGCTNYGGYSYVSMPTTSCSSEATGRAGGVNGLLISAAKNAIDRGYMTPYIRDNGTQADYPLSAEEAMQLWRLAADDIDFSTPCPQHAGCKDAGDILSVLLPGLVGTLTGPFPDPLKTPLTKLADLLSVPLSALPDINPALALPNNYVTTTPIPTLRYQTERGWDFFTGYGRANNGRLLRMIGRDGDPLRIYGDPALTAQDRIPPEADISSPLWWTQYPYKPDHTLLRSGNSGDKTDIVVSGHAAANRITADGGTFDLVLEWAPGAQAQPWPGGNSPAAGSNENSGGPWTVAASRQGLTHAINGELGRIPVSAIIAAQKSYAYPFNPDPTSPYKPAQYAVRLRLRVIAHPANPADDINNEAVFQKQIDVYPATEAVMRDDLGRNGTRAGGSPSPVFEDLNGDGTDELIIASGDGLVHAYTNVRTGAELPGWPVHTLPLPLPTTGNNAYTRGNVPSNFHTAILLGSPAIADLDDDGKLEVIVGDLGGHIYAWEPDGSLRNGFPVHVDYAISHPVPCTPATIPECEIYAPGGRKRNQFNRRNDWITAQPSVGDLDKSHIGLEIIAGAGDGHVYAWHADGSPVPGWPVVLRDPATVASMDPQTQYYTFKSGVDAAEQGMIVTTPSLGDIDGDGYLNVISGVNEEYIETPNADLVTGALTNLLGSNGLALLDTGNTRLYVLHHDGTLHSASAPDVNANVVNTPHTEDQAYLKGWPVKMAMVDVGLLPDVGEGTDSPAVLADIDGNGTAEIIAASAAGLGYIFRGDGSSFLGQTLGKPNTLSELAIGTDTPAFVAVSALSVGSIDGGAHLTVAGGTGGLQRVLDLVLTGNQILANDYLSLWNAQTGLMEVGAPIIVNDLQFFVQPIFADITGDGRAEVIESTAVNDTVIASPGLLDAGLGLGFDVTRLHSGGWIVASAAVGVAPLGDKKPTNLSLVTTTREGYLRIYPTTTPVDGAHNCVALSQWPKYQHDIHNSGNYGTDAERPYPLTGVTATAGPGGTVAIAFTATGDDRLCGQADHYALRRATDGQPGWNAATRVGVFPVIKAAGETASFIAKTNVGGHQTYLLRAYDAAGNGSAVTRIALNTGTGGQQGDTGDTGGTGNTGDSGGNTNGSGSSNGSTSGGGGGCALAATPQPFDPTLLLLLAVALLLCWRRARH